jgi:antitoxin component of RelBE/YafQ-DinJ toxin-antitoxin module
MKPFNERLEIRINKETRKKLLSVCDQEHLKVSTFVRIMIEKYLEERK